jgi:hypothetical protein
MMADGLKPEIPPWANEYTPSRPANLDPDKPSRSFEVRATRSVDSLPWLEERWRYVGVTSHRRWPWWWPFTRFRWTACLYFQPRDDV